MNKAAYLILHREGKLAERVDAQRAYEVGLINKAVPFDQLESEVQRVLGELRRSRRESAILKNKMMKLI